MSDLYSKVIRNFNFPVGLYFRGHGRFYRHYQEVEKNQWLSPKEIQSMQWERLQKLLEEARAHVPHWRNAFEQLKLEKIEALKATKGINNEKRVILTKKGKKLAEHISAALKLLK